MDCERLFRRLENFDTDGLHSEFMAFFQDLIQLNNEKKSKKNKKKTGGKFAKEDSLIRPLAKHFLPVLSRLLKICRDLLSTPSKDGEARRRALEVFQIFKMALDCFDCISPCLEAKPFDVDLQRYRLVRRMEAWSLYVEARDQAYLVLCNLRNVFSDENGPSDTEEDGPYLFSDRAANSDPELALLTIEAVASIVRCAFKRKCKELTEYHKISVMTEQLRPWLSILDRKNFEKYHGILLDAVCKCTFFIIEESSSFKGDLVSRFCSLTISECLRSQSGDMFTMAVHGLSSSLGSHCQSMPSVFLDTMKYALDAIVCKCKQGVIYNINHILDIVSFCMSSLCNLSKDIQKDAALICDASRCSFEVVFPHVAAVLSIYSAGSFISAGDVFGSSEQSVVSEEAYHCKTEYQYYFITLSASISLINSETCGSRLNEADDETFTTSSAFSKSHPEGSGICSMVHGKVSLVSYLKGLAFFCKPFEEYVRKEWKHMSMKKEMLGFGNIIHILDTLCLFCNAFMSRFSDLPVKDRERMRNGFFLVAKAALKISFISDTLLEETLNCIKCIVSKDWIQPQELKFLVSTLYGVGFSKYKDNQLDKFKMEGLQSSIKVLSEIISVLVHARGDDSIRHLLALTYCLCALFRSEADSSSEVFLSDICAALKLWSEMAVSDFSFCCDQFQSVIVSELPLLYHTADLLATKGLWHFQSEILGIIIMLSLKKGIPLEESLIMFCRDRRLSHTFCMSPIDKGFLLKLKQFAVSSDSVAFWTSCMKGDALSTHAFCQKFLPSDLIINPSNFNLFEGPMSGFLNTIEEIKASACALTSKDNIDSHSLVSAGHLYYDLSDRLLSSGQLIEALLYSRKALQLRTSLLQRFFSFSIEKQPTTGVDVFESMLDNKSYHVHLEAHRTAMKEVWLNISKSGLGLRSFVSPWFVVQCYLESSLQVATLHDLVGNGDDAEYHFLIGKHVSKLRGLKLFEVLFCSWLVHTYRRKHLWDLAEKEVIYGKAVLMECSNTEVCKLCKLALDATLEIRLADLIRSSFERTKKASLVSALEHYMLAENILRSFRSEVACLHCRELDPAVDDARACAACSQNQGKFDTDAICWQRDAHDCRETCASWKNYVMIHGSEQGRPRTRRLDAKPESRQSNSSIRPRKWRSTKTTQHKSSQPHDKDYACVNTKVDSDGVTLLAQRDCWRCFIIRMTSSGRILDLVLLKLEQYRRSLLLRLLIQMGKCKRMLGKICEAHDIFCQSACLLFRRTLSSEASDALHHLIGYVENESKGVVFTIEHALLFYQISRFCLDHHLSDLLKICGCGLQNVKVQSVVTLLEHAFIICREVPLLFRKVSRLLAVIHLASLPGGPFHLPVKRDNFLTLYHWAGYFHQASLGGYLHNQNLIVLGKKRENISSTDPQESRFVLSDDVLVETCNSLRSAPDCVGDLERFVVGFFQHLPTITITCLSLLGGDDANVLGEMSLLPCAPFSAWIFLSRLSRGKQPVSFLLPMDVISRDGTDSKISLASSLADSSKTWACSWGCSLLDDMAPDFRQILEENYISGSSLLPVDTNENLAIFWKWRKHLNNHLMALLRDIEESWFGPWKCLLLGELIDWTLLDDVTRRLIVNLRNFNFEANESLLRAILSSHSIADSEACISQLLSYRGWLGFGECCSRKKGRVLFTSTSNDEEESLDECYQFILSALSEFVNQGEARREPLVLVLDVDVQMLPWENLPVLRNEEVYRMPSVGSISVLVDRWRSNNELLAREDTGDGGILPCINLFDAFYLLNPGGDLSSTQKEFEEWFQSQNWEGKISVPTEDELIVALQKHDLFLYLGHGSGGQYLSGRKIEMLDRCAAALLMGCSSGCLSYKGCYLPKGMPLSYLIAGCPTVIANLWDVTDKDIDKFSKELLKNWLEREPTVSAVQEELQNLRINSTKLRKRVPRGNSRAVKSQKDNCTDIDRNSEQLRVASFMGKARDACKLPYLIGASSVVYGVPTSIRKNKR